MANLILPPKWAIQGLKPTPEGIFLNRRRFIRGAGSTAMTIGGALATLSVWGPASACAQEPESSRGLFEPPKGPQPVGGLYPAARTEKYELARPLTSEEIAGTHNNFYEFANGQSHGQAFQKAVAEAARDYEFRPWEVEIGGLCESPRTMSIDDIEKLAPLEERLYRFRCVETWAMAVPWTGYSLSKLIEAAKPKPEAKYVRFVSWHDPEIPAVAGTSWYPWPYFEALRLDEAMNELTMICTGIYGHALSPQHGAPLRIVTPWKYGYKSLKSIRKIEFTAERPPAFWNQLQSAEYGFYSNVDPGKPHPRWSQAWEWDIPDRGNRRPTVIYNGYADFVQSLYTGDEV